MGEQVELTKFEGIYVPKHLVEQMKQERRLVGNPIRPEGLAREMNRAARREEARRLKKAPSTQADPIKPGAPISQREALDRVASELVEQGLMGSTVGTLTQFLGRMEAKILQEAWTKGRPIPRDIIRNALAEIRRQAERRKR